MNALRERSLRTQARRALFYLLAAVVCASAWLEPAVCAAAFDKADLRLAPDLDARVLSGYPRTVHSLYGPLTVGVELRNRGVERRVLIQIGGISGSARQIRVPAGEQVRSFFYLPTASMYDSRTVELTELQTGAHRVVDVNARVERKETVARLGPLAGALNVADPYTMLGALDEYMPDDWRGLSGLRVIVVDHAYAASQRLDWKVLMDWVAMGGLLLIATPSDAFHTPPWPGMPAFAAEPRSTSEAVIHRIGLGEIALVMPQALEQMDAQLPERLDLCDGCRWQLANELPDRLAAIVAKRLEDVVQPPGAAVFLILLAFVVVTGPLGWLRFVRARGQPLRYVAFATASALVFSLAVLTQDLLQNGIALKCEAGSLLLIDQRAGREIGVEEAALYAPSGHGTELRAPLDGELFPPRGRRLQSDAYEWTASRSEQRIERGVPVRQRTFAAARWISRRAGGLEVQMAEGGLEVENQLGVDLRGLSLWSSQRPRVRFELAGLRRGERGLARPSDAPFAPAARVPPFDAVVGAARSLYYALADGALGADRFVAEAVWTPASSHLVSARGVSANTTPHVIAGVYR